MSEERTWNCIGHYPTKWALGIKHKEKLQDVKAVAIRNSNGSWDWYTTTLPIPHHGNDPSLSEAIKSSEKALQDQ